MTYVRCKPPPGTWDLLACGFGKGHHQEDFRQGAQQRETALRSDARVLPDAIHPNQAALRDAIHLSSINRGLKPTATIKGRSATGEPKAWPQFRWIFRQL